MEKSKKQLNAEIKHEVNNILSNLKTMSEPEKEEYIKQLYRKSRSIPRQIDRVDMQKEDVLDQIRVYNDGAFNDGYQLSENIVGSIWISSFLACNMVSALVCCTQGLSFEQCLNAAGIAAMASLVTAVGNTFAKIHAPASKTFLNIKNRMLDKRSKELKKEERVVECVIDKIEEMEN